MSAGMRFERRDALICAGFAVYAVLFAFGRWQGCRPFLHLGGDAANIASYAAALADPVAFRGDSSLGDPAALRFYATLHIPLLRVLRPLAGDWGSAYALLLGPHVFAIGVGFYWLGRRVFGRRAWALLFAVANLAPVWLDLGEFWGPYKDALPRVGFQAALPWLWWLALSEAPGRRRAVLAMGCAGALFYVHPVSAPAWGVAIGLGLCGDRATGRSWRDHLGDLASGALAFALASAPFVWRYVGAESSPVPPEQAAQIVAAVRRHLFAHYFDAFSVLVAFAEKLQGLKGAAFVAAAISLAALGWRGGRERRLATRIALWSLGIAAVALALPALDQALARSQGRMPLQVDLVRNLRYFVPLVLLALFAGCAALYDTLLRQNAQRSRIAAAALLALGVSFTLAWARFRPAPEVRSALQGLSHAPRLCWNPNWPVEAEAIEAIRQHTRRGDRLLDISQSLPIRYGAERALVHSRRDLGVLLYARRGDLPAWSQRGQRMVVAARIRDPEQRFLAYLRLAREWDADYVVIPGRLRPNGIPIRRDEFAGVPIAWRSRFYTLVEVSAAAPALRSQASSSAAALRRKTR